MSVHVAKIDARTDVVPGEYISGTTWAEPWNSSPTRPRSKPSSWTMWAGASAKSGLAQKEFHDRRRRRVDLGVAGREVARVGHHDDAVGRTPGFTAQVHERERLIQRGRCFDADLAAVVGAEAEPHLRVRLRQRGVRRARADRVDTHAFFEERH